LENNTATMSAVSTAGTAFGSEFFPKEGNAAHASASGFHRKGCMVNKFHLNSRMNINPVLYIF
jgi:hypothetical protein